MSHVRRSNRYNFLVLKLPSHHFDGRHQIRVARHKQSSVVFASVRIVEKPDAFLGRVLKAGRIASWPRLAGMPPVQRAGRKKKRTSVPQERSLAQTSSECAFPLHADAGLLAQPGRNLVLDPARKVATRRFVHFRRATPRAYRCLHRNLQPARQAIRLDQSQGPSKTHQSPFRGNSDSRY
jgi:hypothetical protein